MNTIRTTMLAAALSLTAMVSTAHAQVDESAKAILVESAKAIRDCKGITFNSKRSATGVLKELIDSSGSVKLLRTADNNAAMVLIDGRIKQPGKTDRKMNMMSNGSIAQWLDWDKNLLFERSMAEREADVEFKVAQQILPAVFVEAQPFDKELRAAKIQRVGNQKIGEEMCEVIEVSTNASSNVTWAISAIDRLPRKVTQTSGTGDQAISMMLEISDLKSAPLTAKDFDLAMPTNFTKDLKKVTPPAQAVDPNATATAPIERPVLGLAPATALPAFSVTDANGQTITNESLKGGGYTVLHFFGSSFKASTNGLEDLQALSDSMKDKNVKIVGMACRESSDTAAAELFQKRSISYTLVPKADGVLGDMKVVGFPSYYIVKPDGTVAAFLQGAQTRNQLEQAIQDAMK